jgi:hypothetical protein
VLKRLLFVASCGFAFVSFCALTPVTAYGQDRHGNHVPPVPTYIEVDEGFVPFFITHAVGTQDYMCVSTSNGPAWRLFGPQATLFHEGGGELRQQLATHFLSANPEEDWLPRPTWQHSIDSSRVWGRMYRSSDDANFVAAGAIPWLLVAVVGADAGPVGSGFLTPAKFIHRINTAGGSAPATGCTQPSNIGATVLVPYEADYIFYRESVER